MTSFIRSASGVRGSRLNFSREFTLPTPASLRRQAVTVPYNVLFKLAIDFAISGVSYVNNARGLSEPAKSRYQNKVQLCRPARCSNSKLMTFTVMLCYCLVYLSQTSKTTL